MFRVEQLKPLVHVFGHIHYGYGGVYDKNTLYVNTATCNERYQPINAPIVIDLKEYDGKIEPIYVSKF